MKVKTKEFKKAIANCNLVAKNDKNFNFVNFIFRKNSLLLSASTLQENYKTELKGENSGNCSFLVNSSQISKIAKGIKTAETELIIQGEKLVIRAGVDYSIDVIADTDILPKLEATKNSSFAVKITNQQVLFDIVKKVSFSTTKANENKAYSGLLFANNKEKGFSEIVATDNHRLSYVTTKIFESEVDFVVGVEHLKNILKIFSSSKISVKILDFGTETAKTLVVKGGNNLYSAKLIKNEFPNYRAIIEKYADKKSGFYVINKAVFFDKLKGIVSASSDKITQTLFDFACDKLFITTETVQADLAVKPVNVSSSKTVAVDAKKVLDVVNSVEAVSMNIEGGFSPVFFEEKTKDYCYNHYLMPLRANLEQFRAVEAIEAIDKAKSAEKVPETEKVEVAEVKQAEKTEIKEEAQEVETVKRESNAKIDQDYKEKIKQLQESVKSVSLEDLQKFAKNWARGYIAGLYNYSCYNFVLASGQIRARKGLELQAIASFKGWKEKGRFVKKGESAISILAPIIKAIEIKDKKTGEIAEEKKAIGYRMVPVFDLSQTEQIKGVEDKLKVFAGGYVGKDTQGKSLLSFEQLTSSFKVPCVVIEVTEGAEGYTDGKKIIVLKKDNEQMIATYLHELGHCLLHFGKNADKITSSVAELEAETVSYVVCSILGISNEFSKLYLKGWNADTNLMKKIRVAKVISAIDKIVKRLMERHKEVFEG